MNIRAFGNYVSVVINSIDAEDNHHNYNENQVFNQQGRWALRFLEKHFKDKHQNIRRWLNGHKCVFVSDKTGELIEINIGHDIEALYYFLLFCKRIGDGIKIDEDFRDYLAVVIARSCNSHNWSEC